MSFCNAMDLRKNSIFLEIFFFILSFLIKIDKL